MTKPSPIVPGPAVALDARELRDVELGGGAHLAVVDRQLDGQVLGRDACPRRRRSRARARARPRASIRRSARRQRAGEPDRLVRLGRVRVRRQLARLAPVGEHAVRPEVGQVLDEEDVGEPPRRDRAEVVAHAEVLGAVHGRHLDRDQRVDPLLDRPAQDAVHVPVGDDRVGQDVVGDEQAVARVDAVLGQHRRRARRRRGRSSPRGTAPTSRRGASRARPRARSSRGTSRCRRRCTPGGGGRARRRGSSGR